MAALSVGMRLGSYEVTAPLGAGGMGEVYRARDPRLERDVALKVLPSEAFADPTARERLGREARSAAALSHPHICTVYEVGEDSGHVYIAMEFLEGETLAARLARSSGGLPAAEVTRYGAQIAAALAHAHARAIVHRDLKLTNVMLTRDGWVKVLDFGLARRVSGVDERTPTIAASLTGTRGIVGTPQYMAPEILLGSSADPRSDLWAMGVMLHELVSGELPFRGPSNFELSSAIVHDEPSPLPGRVPAGLRMVIARCLTKAPEQRYGSAAEVRAALEALSSGASSDPPMPAAEIPVVSPKSSAIRGFTQRWPRWVWMAGALAAAAVVGTAVLRGLPNPPAKIAPTQRQVTFTGDIMRPSLSPDGKSVAYIHWDHAGGHLMIQDLAAGSPLDILSGARILGVTGGSETEGGLRWSPDGSALMTVALIPPDSASSIYLVPRLGGRPRNLGAFGTTYAWSPDGKRVAIGRVSNSRVRFYNLETGDTSSIALSGPIVWVLGIDWSEARDRLLALTVGPAGQRDLSTFRPDGREQRTLASGPISSARWSCSGAAIYYLASHGQTAELFRIDIRRDGSAAGRPVQVYSGLRRASWLGSSRDGRSAVYLSADASWSRLQALVLPAAGKGRGSVVNRELTSGTSNDQGPALSPDGHWVAFTRLDDKGTNIYVMPFEGGAVRQLTFGAANCRAPAWSPDGRELAFVSDQGGPLRIWHLPVQGGVAVPYPAVSISESGARVEWAPGARIVYSRQGNRNFGLLDPVSGKDTSVLRDESAGWIFDARYSPDGSKLAAYWNRGDGSAKTGIWEIGIADTSRSLLYRTSWLGEHVMGWSRDGRWIYTTDPMPIRIATGTQRKREVVLDDSLSIRRRIDRIEPLQSGECVLFSTASRFAQDAWLLENLPVPRR